MKRPARISIKLVCFVAAAAVLGAAGIAVARRFAQPQVDVTSITRGPVVQAFYATGTIVPEREYDVRANVAGILFLEAGIDKGVAVNKNQLLARVVSDDLEKMLKRAEAELKEKKARADETNSPVLAEFDKRAEAYSEILKLGKSELQRLLTLSETGSAQRVEIERVQNHIATARGDLEATKALRATKLLELKKDLDVAQSTYDIAKWNSEQQEIRAPVGGVILDWPVPNRTRLAINDHVLMLADVRPDRLVMRAAVDEEDKNKLFAGQVVKMTLYSFPDDKFLGRVKTIYDKADAQRRTFEVDVEIARPTRTTAPTTKTSTPGQSGGSTSDQSAAPDPPSTRSTATSPATRPDRYARFAPGMTGELAFIEQDKEVADILPRQALQGDWFYVVKNNKIHRVPAQPGVRNVTRVEVLGGLDPDAQVVLSPIGKLQPGDQVRPHYMDPKTAAELNNPDNTIFKGGF